MKKRPLTLKHVKLAVIHADAQFRSYRDKRITVTVPANSMFINHDLDTRADFWAKVVETKLFKAKMDRLIPPDVNLGIVHGAAFDGQFLIATILP